MKWFSWVWWNEKVIEVPEHYFDWMAPRWYLVVVCAAYASMLLMALNIVGLSK